VHKTGKEDSMLLISMCGDENRDILGLRIDPLQYFIDIVDDSIMHFRKYIRSLCGNFCPDNLKYFQYHNMH